jgi:PAS domain S-box-containing protein
MNPSADLKELSQLLVQQVSDYAIFILDLGGHIISWNDGAELIKGYDPHEILGKHFSIFYTPDDLAGGKPDYELRMARERGHNVDESWRVRKDGSRFWANETMGTLRNRAGELIGYTKITRDLSERKRMEDALRRSEERYRTVVEGVEDYAIFSMDVHHRVTNWNKAATAIMGYTHEEIVGRSSDIIFTAEDRAQNAAQKERQKADVVGRSEDERWHLRKDGTRFWASGVLTAIRDETGQVNGYFKVLRDHTERKRLEDEKSSLLAREQAARETAEVAMRLRDEFLAVVSHELRTPLSAILLWAHILRSQNLPDNERVEAAEVIEKSAKAQQTLIEDLLDVSRILSGNLRLALKSTELTVAVRAAIDLLRPAADAKSVRLEALLDPNAGTARIDPVRIQQVVGNLVGNAVKFTDAGGLVQVFLERAKTDSGEDANEVQVRVTDTGRGISAEFLPFVFDRFRQADASTTRRDGGLGLGLSIVKQLVELHGGTIRAQSPGPGKGATFTMRLPMLAAPELASASQPGVNHDAGMPAMQGVQVLLVEDEQNTRRAAAWVLEQAGAQVTAVGSAEEAFRALSASTNGRAHHVLVSDIGMPGEDGYTLIRRVREMEASLRREQIPAAALTAYAGEEERTKALTAGFQMYLRKPIDFDELVRSVARLAGKA